MTKRAMHLVHSKQRFSHFTKKMYHNLYTYLSEICDLGHLERENNFLV